MSDLDKAIAELRERVDNSKHWIQHVSTHSYITEKVLEKLRPQKEELREDQKVLAWLIELKQLRANQKQRAIDALEKIEKWIDENSEYCRNEQADIVEVYPLRAKIKELKESK